MAGLPDRLDASIERDNEEVALDNPGEFIPELLLLWFRGAVLGL
jgi:hypothetical protein